MNHLLEWIHRYPYASVGIAVLLDQLGVPVPCYPLMLLAGALAYQGGASLGGLLITAVVAAVVADVAWYVAGAKLGNRALRLLCKVSISPDSCVRQTENIFARAGLRSLLVAKFIPGLGAVATALAGVQRAPIPAFLAFDAGGAVFWAGVPLLLGVLFHNAIGDVTATLGDLGRKGAELVLAALAVFIAIKILRRWLLLRELRMARVSVHELHAMIASGEPLAIIDARLPGAQLIGGRIPGARTADEHLDTLRSQPALEVVVYCACPNEVSAAKVALKLRQAGFTRVRPLLGGIEAWRAAGFTVEMSA
ncbi:MAG TPA: rhodanese-like domain-containing protein [Steroidobacteraceae bacterium]|jgi:membrane protein DedA with SNARE-associated domain/rhodanese-related sulfurtransferase